jgi:glycosyltransferase involved in cell wall biosynthesis
MTDFPKKWSGLRTVLCHDWLTGMRGGERVLEILCEGFNDAPVMTLIHKREAISSIINAHPVSTSMLQRVPGIFEHYRYWLPAFPAAVRGLRPPPADLMISTSHCVAKAVRPPSGARHLCYCFTPMRYAWLFQAEYLGSNPVKRLAARPILAWLRRWDERVSGRVTRFVAISSHVQERIARFYGRESDVVHPPVDTIRCTPGTESPGDYDLMVTAMVPYKRVDLAVKAYTQSGRKLKIVGTGTESDRLRSLAGGNVEFLGWCPDEAILGLYRRCRLLVFPGEEDFGIVPLEAQACGRPVVAFGRGGALETVIDGRTGVFFGEQTEKALLEAVSRCADTAWDSGAIRAHAEGFGVHAFIGGLASSIEQCMASAPAQE